MIMKANRSLALSSKIQECKMGNIIGLLENEFPSSIFENQNEAVNVSAKFITDNQDQGKKAKKRERVFTEKSTLLTMVLTSVQQDKTLKNSVDLFYIIHQKQKSQALEQIDQHIEEHKIESSKLIKKKVGRQRRVTIPLRKSLENDISLNTAAYCKARNRVPIELVKNLFKETRIEQANNNYSHWHGFRILLGDGTYVQMQDTESLRKEYEVKYKGVASEAYPQGLLETIIDRGTGQIYNFKLSNRHTSELSLFYDMLDDMPKNTLLLLDDLYNCYEIISKFKRLGINIVVPAKRERNYEFVERLGEGDEIITINTPKNRSKWIEKNEEPGKLILRRITCKSPEGEDYVLFTTVLDTNIPKEEIQLLYLTRWDIEIGIREIKTIMDINVLRSKTPEMVLKELTVSLATYNLIRKIIYASIKDLPFSPKEDIIHQYYTFNQIILIDKKGRVYNRWSTGRRRNETIDITTNAPKAQAEQTI
jgi:hypothetical protein